MSICLKIAVIIPAYNVEKYIFRAIESCIQQTYRNIEIVVVDDGSADKTYDVVKVYADRDERVKLYRQNNQGVSSARNRALDMCSADYVLFLDSDDWLEINAIEKLVQHLDGNRNHSLISSGCYYAYFDADANIYKVIPGNEENTIVMTAEDVLLFVGQTKYNLRSACYKLFSLDVINQHNIRFAPEIKHGEDGLFVFEYLKHTDTFVYFPNPLWNILERPGSATTSPYNRAKMSALTAVNRMLEYKDNSKKLTQELQKFYVQRALYVLSEALVAQPMPKDDVALLRKVLRRQFWVYIVLQKSFKLKLIYLLEVFAPKPLAKFLLESRDKK